MWDIIHSTMKNDVFLHHAAEINENHQGWAS